MRNAAPIKTAACRRSTLGTPLARDHGEVQRQQASSALNVEGQHGLAVNGHDSVDTRGNAPMHGQLKVLMGEHEPTHDVTQGTDRGLEISSERSIPTAELFSSFLTRLTGTPSLLFFKSETSSRTAIIQKQNKHYRPSYIKTRKMTGYLSAISIQRQMQVETHRLLV
jgi:hypothetical protein